MPVPDKEITRAGSDEEEQNRVELVHHRIPKVLHGTRALRLDTHVPLYSGGAVQPVHHARHNTCGGKRLRRIFFVTNPLAVWEARIATPTSNHIERREGVHMTLMMLDMPDQHTPDALSHTLVV